MKACRGKRIIAGITLVSLSLIMLVGCGKEKGDSIFEGDMDCEYVGSTLELDEENLRVKLSYQSDGHSGIEGVSNGYEFQWSGIRELYYNNLTLINSRLYSIDGEVMFDELEVYIRKNGKADISFTPIIMHSEDDWTYVDYNKKKYESNPFLCKSEYVRKEDALNRVDTFVIKDQESDKIIETVKDGKLLNVIYTGQSDGQYIYLNHDFEEGDTSIALVVDDVNAAFFAKDIVYDVENTFRIKQGKESYKINLLVTESEIRAECKGATYIFREEDIEKTTIIQNW